MCISTWWQDLFFSEKTNFYKTDFLFWNSILFISIDSLFYANITNVFLFPAISLFYANITNVFHF